MSRFIPKNAHKILANPTLTRDFFMKPYGLDVVFVILRFLKIRICPKSIQSINLWNIK